MPPLNWSVVADEGIAWKKTLPETGQSTVITTTNPEGKHLAFFTTMQEVNADSELGSNIVAWCIDADTGNTLWMREMAGTYPLRLSGCFSDSTGPPPVCDGQRVCFFNASGTIECFDLSGNSLWTREIMAVGRSQPFMVDGKVVFTRQKYMPDEKGHFTHEHHDAPVQEWTQLQALQMSNGHDAWSTQCGVNMGCVPLLQKLSDGKSVIAVGRGGGHAPPEKPEGISLVDASNGDTLWTLPLPGFMSTMSFHIRNDQLMAFHDDKHLWIDARTGKIARQKSFLNNVTVRRHESKKGWHSEVETLPGPKKKRAIIQQSNIVVGDYHYFRSYTEPYMGRVHLDSGAVEYLQLPVQLKKTIDKEVLLWDDAGMPAETVAKLKSQSKKKSKRVPINQWCFEPNDMKNSRGFQVMGDARSRGTGWGHHASQIPTAVGRHLFVPIMNGTVYVLDLSVSAWDETAIAAINDLGTVGRSFNRASLSSSNGKLYAHTIREIVCIGH